MEIAIVGNPNVGKSVLFYKITGVGVVSSNYPGTTVEILKGEVKWGDRTIEVYDLPGIYSLSGAGEDEAVALEFLAENRPDCVIAVADATRMEKSLVLIFELLEMGFPTVVALNFMDLARRRYDIDVEHLSEILGVPVVPTVAVTGEGVDRLCALAFSGVEVREFRVGYDKHVEEIVEELSAMVTENPTLSLRGALLKLLEGNEFFTQKFPEEVRALAQSRTREFEAIHGETIDVHIGRDRYGEAGRIVSEVTSRLEVEETLTEKVSRMTLQPATGLPMLIVILLGIFFSVIYLGGFLEEMILDGYEALVGEFFGDLAQLIGGKVGEAISMGVNLSIMAILAIVIPYILVFYLILGILEDSGYLPRVVVMLDGLMHRLGLHGRAVIPMIVGLGCNVPAILATRVLESRRERLILAAITVMAIPCSAQTVIIIGTVGNHAGIQWAALIYLILFALVLILGRLMHRLMKFEPSSLLIEVPDLVMPRPGNVLMKTGMRVGEFFYIAFPLLLIGSVLLEFLMVYGVLDAIVDPLSPLTVGLLGLPPVTIIALIFGVLRKEMALQLLVVLFGATNLALFLTPQQMFVFALVMATYVPCVAAFAVIRAEFGWKDALKITGASISLSLILGTLAHLVLSAL